MYCTYIHEYFFLFRSDLLLPDYSGSPPFAYLFFDESIKKLLHRSDHNYGGGGEGHVPLVEHFWGVLKTARAD
jgi:hypothetical protein